ncbi:succinate-semialdehyde dehydrogenase/glutarate-semialdehyde dehydrogenase [Thermocatellispora tengchongensis]|uniref:Succinate-semialdehyde dehydrogenase/glutarate-semialdehyde dehydrogenase n=1 Tax=Thermocatellispora tengchongensis TaxID=1073253 RepID=A0A840PDH1_9ACTN|nr:aldehyde dehydrogenase family protein [Thermocatellispora tengchongensis]MBB5137262.1 succinate-semialdehyde dehydrogenase/glutarate-semialdehyde dehydrogenase [Thermocatellispora tengchongensis]
MTTATQPPTAPPIAVTDPATGQVVRKAAAHTPPEVERRVRAAHDAARVLRGTDFATRASWMRESAALLEADAADVARAIVTEMGKPIRQARDEVAKSVRTMRFYAGHAAAFLADTPLEAPERVGARRALTRYQPLGVVLAVMPWNYPIWQVIRFAAPALMAGNAGLLKHAPNVPDSALYLDSLFARGGFPAGAFGALLAGSDVVEGIIADPRIAAVTLTGSEGAGRAVGAAAGRAIKKAVLELGGSDPFVVMPSADVGKAAATALAARMNNNGQSCIAGKRFIVHTDVYDEFAGLFAEKIAALTVGDPFDEATDIGPIATARGRDELAAQVDDAVAHGARVLATAATPADTAGWYYPPTLLEGVGPECRLFREEAFGPVAVLYRARDEQEAVALANGTPYGLSSSVWTSDPEQERRMIDALEAGAVFVNGMSVSYPELPFGGIRNSGYGRELGPAGIREFCNMKTVWIA